MGRRKIPIRLIEQDSVRHATFGKRKIGLLKKAMELSILCDCEISVTIRPRREDPKMMFVYASDPFDELQERYRKYRGKYTLFNNDDIHECIPGSNTSSDAGDKLTKRKDDIKIESAQKFERSADIKKAQDLKRKIAEMEKMPQFMSVPVVLQPQQHQVRCVSMNNMAMMPPSTLDLLLNPLFDALPPMNEVDLNGNSIPPEIPCAIPMAIKKKKMKRDAEEMMDGDGEQSMGIHSEGPPIKKLKPNAGPPKSVGIRMDELCHLSVDKM